MARALGDPDESVARAACAWLGGHLPSLPPDAARALEGALAAHPSWHVRFEAARAFLDHGRASDRVVAALERLSREEGAAAYDRARALLLAAGHPEDGLCPWGDMRSILDRARRLRREAP